MKNFLKKIFSAFSLPKIPQDKLYEYELEYNKFSLFFLRFTSSLVLIVNVIYYFLDFYAAFHTHLIIWLIRFINLTLLPVLVIILSFSDWFKNKYQLIVTAFVAIMSLSIVLMISFCHPLDRCYETYYVGILVLNSLTLTTHLHLKNAFYIYIMSLLAYLGVSIFFQHIYLHPDLMLNNLLFMFSMMLAFTVAHYFLEFYARRLFLSNLEIKEKNKELLIRNEEIKQQNVELEAQKNLLSEQKRLLEDFNKKLLDSIHYAQRIQNALLPSVDTLAAEVRDYFLFFRPKDVVSGDFYWWAKKGDKLWLIAADCTGHGVPGAFMSVLSISFIQDLINRDSRITTGQLLNKLRDKIIISLRQYDSNSLQNDGLELAAVKIDKTKHQIEYSGAFYFTFFLTKKPLSLDSNKARKYADKNWLLYEMLPNKMPVGVYRRYEDFRTIRFSYTEPIKIIFTSDGFLDQIDVDLHKIGRARFRTLLLQWADLSMKEFGHMLKEYFEQWRDRNKQLDDVMVLGIEL